MKHGLYVEALGLWKGDEEKSASLLEVYGEWFFDRREFSAAGLGWHCSYSSPYERIIDNISGLAFVQAKRLRKAMVAYEKAAMWQELFGIAVNEKLESEELRDMALRVAG